ncbi:MAG: 50S ribosomal protein L3 [Thermoplasmata archaeon]|nr:MAG: 50S ribosomal protein L3 [Thermoplasmata archaeon]RLF63797.1 MAG: 50S ribosomal protein L3 [Thermoplasmata archaeon]
MPTKHHPRRGSKGYSPRKRARSEVPRIQSWPNGDDKPRLQGFAGYKAGMTHVFVVDYRPTSTTSGQEVMVPVTVVETPPMKIAAIRVYKSTPYGLKTVTETWADNVEELKGRIPIPKKTKELEVEDFDDIRVIAYTKPRDVTGVPKKLPEIMEIRIGGGSKEERLNYAKEILGKEVDISDIYSDGSMVDIAAITKGKGFQGPIKRWGLKLLTHKNRKHRRMVGTLGPWLSWVRSTVPQGGQTGYHHRVEYNKRILRIGENGEEITPEGGFLHYGVVRNKYVILHGSIPGPAKRLIRMRDAIRYHRGVKVEKPEITYVSTMSKQGV